MFTGNKLLYLFLLMYACNMEFRLFITLGDESTRLVRQIKSFRFIMKDFCFVTICLSRQALTSIFDLAVSWTFMHTNETIPYYLLIHLKHTSTHSVEKGESFKPHSKAIGHVSPLQHVFFLVLVNNFLSHTCKPFHKPVKTGSQFL